MAAMQALQNASGAEFNTLFVSQMHTMHQAKLTELQSAVRTITDPQLKMAVNRAIPKIKLHTQALARMNKGGSTGGTTSGTTGGTTQQQLGKEYKK